MNCIAVNNNLRRIAALLAAVMLALCLAPSHTVAWTSSAELQAAVKGSSAEEEGAADSGVSLTDETEAWSSLFMRGGSITKKMNESYDMDFSIIRVLITLDTNDEQPKYAVRLVLHGEYYFKSEMYCLNGNGLEGCCVIIRKEGALINAYNEEGALIASGEKLELNRVYVSHEAGYATLYSDISGYSRSTPANNGFSYLGNFVFGTDGNGGLMVVNHVPLAHYIYGVVGYEMNYTCPPESLKAQAIAAKCFGMSFMANEPYWDVKDGYCDSLYQKYRGYSRDPNVLTTLQYCLDVIGEGLSYDGKIIPTFFGASNGGETSLPSIAFGGHSYDMAYSVSIDSVDFAASKNRKTMHISFGPQTAPDEYGSRFLDFILSKARAAYGVAYNSVVSIDQAYCYMPQSGTQRNMKMMYVRATVAAPNGSQLDLELSFETKELKERALQDYDGSGDVYNSWAPCVFNSAFKIFWGVGTSGGYTLYLCRFGHGIGLSQDGAAAMAKPEYGSKTYREILSFYYPNFVSIEITEANPEAPLLTTLDASAYGRCMGGTVYIRTEPRIAADTVLDVIELGDHIDIISSTRDGRWYNVLSNGHMGYMSYKFVSIDMFPAPADAVFTLYTAEAKAGALLYPVPSIFAEDAAALSSESMTLWASLGNWYYAVTADGAAGYVRVDDVIITDEYEFNGSEPIISMAPTPRYFISIASSDSSVPHARRGA